MIPQDNIWIRKVTYILKSTSKYDENPCKNFHSHKCKHTHTVKHNNDNKRWLNFSYKFCISATLVRIPNMNNDDFFKTWLNRNNERWSWLHVCVGESFHLWSCTHQFLFYIFHHPFMITNLKGFPLRLQMG